MKNTTSRLLIETLVRKTLKEVQESPERSARNLVDMALQFSDGSFQHRFFKSAQTMLENEHSSFYNIAADAAAFIDHERLVRFGLNMGYNSYVAGAETIRALEKAEGFNIPWTLFLAMDGESFPDKAAAYEDLLRQGEALGIYTWHVFSMGQPGKILPLIENHPDHAFILFCPPGEITDDLLDEAESLYHLMFAVQYTGDVDGVCQKLRARRFLYSVFVPYSENGLPSLDPGGLLSDAEGLHPVFTAFLPAPPCSQAAQDRFYRRVCDSREQQVYKTIPWDLVSDSCLVDSVISEDACLAGFDAEGSLCTFRDSFERREWNVFRQPLRDILKQAFPKAR